MHGATIKIVRLCYLGQTVVAALGNNPFSKNRVKHITVYGAGKV